MSRPVAAALLVMLALPACRATRTVAVGTARVVTAPAHFVGRKIHGDNRASESDEIYEAQPVPDFLPPPPPPVVRSTPTPAARPHDRMESAAVSPSRMADTTPPAATPSPRSSPAAATAEFPIAKAVPGKPGYVFSPFDGTMIDVTGFASGAKARDPGNNKIFVVP